MIDFIKSQVLTEKTSKLLSQNKYTFDVDISLNKKDISKILEDLFGVKVLSVNSYILPGKKRRLGKFEGFKNNYKRVFVTVAPNNIIPYFSGL
uniref:Large ribosomal subunit protein uL23c n=1 Tax=Monomorphina aenigmatica TaxID=304863 RepID=L0BGQ6_MONAE|nr:ribosomal protein L23 [Monomorphina aenigmatica]AFZ88815.1 ribosomal protein L23 [Monomorphina aenigmatica]